MPDRVTDDILEKALFAVRPAFPPTPPFSAHVPAATGRSVGRRASPRLALGLAIAALVLLAGVAAAGVLGVGPLRILFSESLPSPNVPRTPLGVRLALGQQVAVDALPASSDLTIEIPTALGPPDEAYQAPIGIVSLVYHAGPDLPAMRGSGIGLLLMEIPGSTDPSLIRKMLLSGGTTIERVNVGGHGGYWISGESHVFLYRSKQGVGEVQARLVDAALVWQRDGVVYRIESGLGRDASIVIGSELAPLR